MAIFSNFFFLGNCNISQENVFYDILEQKNAFLGCKSKKFKKSKNWHISKKVNSYIWSKNGHFFNFSFWGNIKTRSLKSRKLDIFQKGLTHGFGPKIPIFSIFFVLGNIGLENVFYDILERKNAFLGYKNKKFKNSKNWHFSKGLTHGFIQKMAIFPSFIF